jgi:osmotically-inducible protein OsmY
MQVASLTFQASVHAPVRNNSIREISMSALVKPRTPLLLEDVVNDMLERSDDSQVRNVHCETSGSEVILRGCVPTASTKQLAQAIAQKACGMRQISNEIIVLGDNRC